MLPLPLLHAVLCLLHAPSSSPWRAASHACAALDRPAPPCALQVDTSELIRQLEARAESLAAQAKQVSGGRCWMPVETR